MKTSLVGIFAVTVLLSSAPAMAQQNMSHGMNHAQHQIIVADSDRHQATGRVVRVNQKRGQVTLDHAPVPSLDWPSMTMGFQVKDPALFEKLKVGAEIEFEFMQDGKKYVVTNVR